MCSKEERAKLEETLVSRRKMLRTFVKDERDKFTKIDDLDWGLNL
ncbi:MAG: hypothetical protein P4L86_13080 [Mycobacterium sp.]|nr:hypothetical protein [Mycobacterium sp.]